MLEAAVSQSVSRPVGCARILNWRGCRSPQLAGFLVAQIQHLARAIRDRIVRPRRELILATVERPCETAAVGRDLEPEARIGDDIDPRSGRRLPRTQQNDVFAPVRGESSESVEEFELARRRTDRRRIRLRLARRRTRGGRGVRVQRVQLVRQAAALSDQHHPRDGSKPRACLFRDQIHAQQEYRAARLVCTELRP